MAITRKLSLKAKGMHCSACAMLIEDGLNELKGIKEIKISHKAGTVDVFFDETKTTPAEIKEAIRKEGYEVISND